MIDRTANLLGVLGLAVFGRIENAARDILKHTGETPAALVVIGYGLGPSNEQLRRILGLSHPGALRLVDRLLALTELIVRQRCVSDWGASLTCILTCTTPAVRAGASVDFTASPSECSSCAAVNLPLDFDVAS